VTETIKRTNRPYFTLQGNICALLAARDHINISMFVAGERAGSVTALPLKPVNVSVTR
jgi:hypothetical protein